MFAPTSAFSAFSVVDELTNRGVQFEHYAEGPKTDEKGILRGRGIQMGPDIAWCKNPSETLEDVGNVAAFAASDLARTMTAITFNITCGREID
jgi:hypothetical protein